MCVCVCVCVCVYVCVCVCMCARLHWENDVRLDQGLTDPVMHTNVRKATPNQLLVSHHPLISARIYFLSRRSLQKYTTSIFKHLILTTISHNTCDIDDHFTARPHQFFYLRGMRN